jgi:lipopolysaccharide export system protein LptA
MKHFAMSAAVFAMLFSLTVFAGATALQAPDSSAEGELINVDLNQNQVTIKTSDDKELRFTFNEQTQVAGDEKGVQGLTPKPGTRVKIQYRTSGETHTAIRIEVIPEKTQ